MAARPTTTVGEVLSLTQGVLANPQVSNSIARLLRRSKQSKDISEALMAELQSGVLSGAAGAQAGRLARYHAQVGNFFERQAKTRGIEAVSKEAGPGALGSAAINAVGALVSEGIKSGLFETDYSKVMAGEADELGLNLAELQDLTLSDAELAEVGYDDPGDPLGLKYNYGGTVLPETMRTPSPEVTSLQPRGQDAYRGEILGTQAFLAPQFENGLYPGGQPRDMPAPPIAPRVPGASGRQSLGIGDFSPGPFERPDTVDLSLPQKREMPAPSYADTEMAQKAQILDSENFRSGTKASKKLSTIGDMTVRQLSDALQDPKEREKIEEMLRAVGQQGGI